MAKANTISFSSAIMLLALAMVWGGSFFFAEIALFELGPFWIVAHRVFWATVVLSAVVWLRGLSLPRSPRVWLAFLVMGILNNAIPFTLIFSGQVLLEGGLASVINASTAVMGAFVAGLLLKDERLTFNKVAGAILGLTGVAVVMGPDAIFALNPADIAQLGILVAALSYALAGVWGKLMLGQVTPEVSALGMLAGSTFIIVPLAYWVEGPAVLTLAFGTWASLAFLAVFSTAAAYLLYFGILRRAGAANLMLVTLLVPPFAVVLGATFLNESLASSAWAGFGLIAIGLLITDGRVPGFLPGRKS